MTEPIDKIVKAFCDNRTRPSAVQYFLMMASLVSVRATCMKKRVGCVLVDDKNRVLATGYNGSAHGLRHCISSPCNDWENNGECLAIHAEQNALIQCSDVSKIHSVYCTTAPCPRCTKLFLNTSCKNIIFAESNRHEPRSRELWMQVQGNSWSKPAKASVPINEDRESLAVKLAREAKYEEIHTKKSTQPCTTCSRFIAPFFCSLAPSNAGARTFVEILAGCDKWSA